MQEQRFDQLTRRLSTATSRRQALKILAGAVVGGLFAGRASGAAATTCKGIGEACSGRLPWECCTRFCGPDGVCGCPLGLESCGGVCHLPCLSGAVRDANCHCSCPPGTTFCLDACSNLQQGTVINPNSPPERQLVTNCGHCGFTCGPGLICHGGDCCAGPGAICTAIGLGKQGTCCTGECSATGKCCSQLAQPCSAASDCCQPGAVCGPGNTCCVQDGQVCSSNEECCNRVCNPATGTCGCLQDGVSCKQDADCCGHHCNGGVCCSAQSLGSTCGGASGTTCCTGVCGPNDTCCVANNQPCPAAGASSCCSGFCLDTICCVPVQGACASTSDCCSGQCGSDGKCCFPPGGDCTQPGDCCSGVCDNTGHCACPTGQLLCPADNACHQCCSNADCPVPGDTCTNGTCGQCVPDCAGVQCGPDGCGGSCGTCTGNQVCSNGSCGQPQFCSDGSAVNSTCNNNAFCVCQDDTSGTPRCFNLLDPQGCNQQGTCPPCEVHGVFSCGGNSACLQGGACVPLC